MKGKIAMISFYVPNAVSSASYFRNNKAEFKGKAAS